MAKREPDGTATQQSVEVPTFAMRTHFASRPWLLALALMLVTFVADTTVWHAGFIWDDDDHLTTNPAMTAPTRVADDLVIVGCVPVLPVGSNNSSPLNVLG